MRASDEDRKRTVDELRRHCAAGRIDVDEYASRIERAMLAASLEELDELRADLPMLRIAEPAGRRPSGARPGFGSLVHLGAGTGEDGHGRRSGVDQSVLAFGVAAITVLVVLAAIVIGLAVEWVWAVLLLAGWAAGLAQGRLGRPGRRDR